DLARREQPPPAVLAGAVGLAVWKPVGPAARLLAPGEATLGPQAPVAVPLPPETIGLAVAIGALRGPGAVLVERAVHAVPRARTEDLPLHHRAIAVKERPYPLRSASPVDAGDGETAVAGDLVIGAVPRPLRVRAGERVIGLRVRRRGADGRAAARARRGLAGRTASAAERRAGEDHQPDHGAPEAASDHDDP